MSQPMLECFDALELWVRDARRTAALFVDVLGFSTDPDVDDHTDDDRVSSTLRRGDARVVVTQATAPRSPVAAYVGEHGDGVKDIGFAVRDVDDAFATVVRRGASPISEPHARQGRRQATITAFGDTTHTLFELVEGLRTVSRRDAGVHDLDHLAVSVEAGSRGRWAEYYEEVLGLERIGRDERVETGGSAFTMATLQGTGGSPTLVLAEPAEGSRPSQIADYLERFGGPGVHHVAFAAGDIFATVAHVRARGLRLLDVPDGYYERTRRRLAGLDVPWEELEDRGILVDRDGDGHLFQVFTAPLGDRPTVHLELIQRAGSKGFGNENVRALYHAVVREQQARDAARSVGRPRT